MVITLPRRLHHSPHQHRLLPPPTTGECPPYTITYDFVLTPLQTSLMPLAVYKRLPFYTPLTNVTQAYTVNGIPSSSLYVDLINLLSMSHVPNNPAHPPASHNRNAFQTPAQTTLKPLPTSPLQHANRPCRIRKLCHRIPCPHRHSLQWVPRNSQRPRDQKPARNNKPPGRNRSDHHDARRAE